MTMRAPFGVLRVRNFRLFFAGQVASNVGTWFQSLAQALLVIELTGSAKALGLVTALQFLPVLLLGPYGGTLADRIPPRALLVITSGMSGLLALGLSAVTAFGKIDVFWIYAVALALGYVQVLDRPAGQAFQYELVGPEDLPQAVGLHSTTMSSARLLGPALAGAAYSLIGSAACFAINGVSFLCVIFALLAMRAAELHPRIRDAKPARGQVVEGVRYAWQHPDLRALLAVNALIGCLAFNFMTTITAMVRFEFHADANALGAAHALNAAGAVLGSLAIAALQRPLTRSALALLCATLGFTILVNALTPGLWWFLLWAPFFGFSVGAYQTAVTTAVQRAAEPGMLGRVSSLLVLGSVGTTPIGSLIVGWLIDAWSARAAMGLGALACGLGAVMLAAAQPIRRTARGACR